MYDILLLHQCHTGDSLEYRHAINTSEILALFYSFKKQNKNLSRLVGKPTMCFLNRSDINWAVQSQEQAGSLKFRILKEEEVYYPCSENKGADQLRGYREADLRLCFRIGRLLFFP